MASLADLERILDFFFYDSQRNVYAGEREVRPPGAPTTERGGARSAITALTSCQRGAGCDAVRRWARYRRSKRGSFARVQIGGTQPPVLAAVERGGVTASGLSYLPSLPSIAVLIHIRTSALSTRARTSAEVQSSCPSDTTATKRFL